MDVGEWLRGLGLSRYEAAFRDNGIDGSVLPHLTAEDLKELAIASVGDRRKLMTAIGALKPSTSSDLTASPQPSPSSPRKTSEVSAERRPITVMFCDLVGSTGLAARLDPEDWRNLVNAYLEAASAAVTELGGHVSKELGDGLMALFGYPRAEENDAERALRAALAIQRALADLNVRNKRAGAPELVARIGLDCGPVVVDAAGEVFGEAPNVAARVQALAEPGAVLVTAAVQAQVAGLFVTEDEGARELKGVAAPVRLFRIVRAASGRRRGGARALTPFVGREEELETLARRFERVRAGEGQLALIVGEPGLGKSRLIEEFRSRLQETPHAWIEWSASQLLQNTALHPVAEWGRRRFGEDAPADQRLSALEGALRFVGLDPAEYAPFLAPLVDIPLPPGRAAAVSPEEQRRRQLAGMTAWVLAGARSEPAVLAFEDLHWADPTSLDLLRALAERGGQAPLLLLATTRPEFRPPWNARAHHSLMSLSPLDRAGVARMVRGISAGHALSAEVIEGINERTGGAPLFVEEVTRLLIERGAEAGAQAIPPTLQHSLAARLDRLGEAREAAQIGAVLGRDFSYALLAAVAGASGAAGDDRGLPPPPRSHAVPLPRAAGEDRSSGAASFLPRKAGEGDHAKHGGGGYGEAALQAALERLAEADLLFVEGAPPNASYHFKHALIRDAAYESLLKSRRQALHRGAAEELLKANAEPEAIAHHFTEAGLDDAAIKWWGRAGDRALRRSGFQEAIAHLGKAIAMADKAAGPARRRADAAASLRRRLTLHTDYGQAMMWSRGYTDETRAAFARATQLAAGSGDFSERFAACHGQWSVEIVRGELTSARELASTSLREAEEEERIVEAGVARRGLALIDFYSGDFPGARTHCERALEACAPGHEEKARERFGEYTGAPVMSCLAVTMWQLGEVDRAREWIETANRRAVELGHVPSMGYPLLFKSHLEILCGDAAAALRSAETLEARAEENGMTLWRRWATLSAAWARGRLHDPAAAADEFRRELAACSDQGAAINMAFFQALLAELEADAMGPESGLKRIDDAAALAGQGDDRWCLAFIHRLRGEILVKRDPSNSAPAEEAFRTAIDVAHEQGARSLGLLAALGLARLCQSTGRPAQARAVLAPALEGFSRTPELPEIAEAQALMERSA
jgi:class 3 adenylate cyclase